MYFAKVEKKNDSQFFPNKNQSENKYCGSRRNMEAPFA